MQKLSFGDVTIASIVERDGPWRLPQAMFPQADAETVARHLAEMPAFVIDGPSGKMLNTYRTYVVRTPHHTILVDTCTGEDKGYPPPMDFPKQPWLDGFHALGLRFDEIDYVFCTHLHSDHCGWNTRLLNGRWVPTFPKAKYIFHKREYAAWEAAAKEAEASGEASKGGSVWQMNCLPVVEAGQALLVDETFELDDLVRLVPTPGHSPCHCCVEIRSGGKTVSVTGDMMHHPLQCREPDWSTIFCWDPAEAVVSRRRYLSRAAEEKMLLLPIHFPGPAAGHVTTDGDRFRYHFVAE